MICSGIKSGHSHKILAYFPVKVLQFQRITTQNQLINVEDNIPITNSLFKMRPFAVLSVLAALAFETSQADTGCIVDLSVYESTADSGERIAYGKYIEIHLHI